MAAELQERICECRRQTGWGPRLVAGASCASSALASLVSCCWAFFSASFRAWSAFGSPTRMLPRTVTGSLTNADVSLSYLLERPPGPGSGRQEEGEGDRERE